MPALVGLSPPDLLIVGIDETSFQELRQAWPWPRRLHAELVRRLAAAQARLIVFDISFADPSTQEDDQLFAEAIRQADNVILAQTVEYTEDPVFSRQILVQPLESLRRAAKGLGLSMVTPDADGVIRHFHLRLGGHDTLPLVAARRLKSRLPLPADLSGLIHYVARRGTSTPCRIIRYWIKTIPCPRPGFATVSSWWGGCRESLSCPRARRIPSTPPSLKEPDN